LKNASGLRRDDEQDLGDSGMTSKYPATPKWREREGGSLPHNKAKSSLTPIP